MFQKILIASLLLLIAASGGCNIASAGFMVLHGPPKVQAVVELDPSRKTVVLIDDLSNRVPRRSLRDIIGNTVDEQLLANKVIDEGNLISSASARRVAGGELRQDRLAAVDVARRVGAEVIVYVSMTGWTLTREAGILSPAASAQIAILDAVENVRLWPPGERTYPFIVEVPSAGGQTPPNSLSEKAKNDQALAKRFGVELAWLFYTHEREYLSDQVRPGQP